MYTTDEMLSSFSDCFLSDIAGNAFCAGSCVAAVLVVLSGLALAGEATAPTSVESCSAAACDLMFDPNLDSQEL